MKRMDTSVQARSRGAVAIVLDGNCPRCSCPRWQLSGWQLS